MPTLRCCFILPWLQFACLEILACLLVSLKYWWFNNAVLWLVWDFLLHQQRQPTVATAETHHHPLRSKTSKNFQQMLVNVSGHHFFHTEEFNSTFLLHVHFHDRYHFLRLSLCLYLLHSNKMDWKVGWTFTIIAIPPPSASNMGQHNKIGFITFRAWWHGTESRLQCKLCQSTYRLRGGQTCTTVSIQLFLLPFSPT